MIVKEILSKRLKELRDLGVKVALNNSIIKIEKNLIKGLTPKKTLAFQCQCMGIEKIKSFSPQLKQNWQNTCHYALKMMFDNEVDELMKVAKYSGETYEMKFLANELKNESFKNKETLQHIFNNMSPIWNKK
mgnify:CR=1 FL=1|tara:strand:- start:23 stop:418 length:396 start_codon:yes stop_codon:yes gene_type:complete